MNIGIIDYLNSLPLNFEIRKKLTFTCLIKSPSPIDLHSKLLTGAVDLGLVSSLNLNFSDKFCSDIPVGIASNGESGSVFLVFPDGYKNDYEHIVNEAHQEHNLTFRSSPHSISSNMLARILLERYYKKVNVTTKQEIELPYVVIGDEALKLKPKRAIDLGQLWKNVTGLPFVYATWQYRKSSTMSFEYLKEIAYEAQKNMRSNCAMDYIGLGGFDGLESKEILDYWKKIYYILGEAELEGLNRYLYESKVILSRNYSSKVNIQ